MYPRESYLRVLTPRTTNGIVPKMQNGEQLYKESFLPLSARKQLEKKNARLTKNGHQHLVAIIETVGEAPVKANPRPINQPVVQQVAEAVQTQEVAQPVTQPVQKLVQEPAKRGRKPNPKPKNQQ